MKNTITNWRKKSCHNQYTVWGMCVHGMQSYCPSCLYC